MGDKEILQKIVSRMDEFNNQLKGINNRLGNVEDKLGETTLIIKALLHRTEELDAKSDNLLNTTTAKDAIIELKPSVQLLNTGLSHQKTKMHPLENNKVTD
jgi:uncharacterized coiled-coil DUF342 family protein